MFQKIERRKSFGLETCLRWSSSFVNYLFFGCREVPSHLCGSVSSFLKMENSCLTSYLCTWRQVSWLALNNIAFLYKREREKKCHTKIFYPFSFPGFWKRFLLSVLVLSFVIIYCYCLLILSYLVFRNFRIFFSPSEVKTVKTLPMWFTFIHVSELFKSVGFCTLGSPGDDHLRWLPCHVDEKSIPVYPSISSTLVPSVLSSLSHLISLPSSLRF